MSVRMKLHSQADIGHGAVRGMPHERSFGLIGAAADGLGNRL